jgi:hypothetical protein
MPSVNHTHPENEVVVVRPPPGCPTSAPGTYWRLNKTLCGLRWSPRHWYALVKRVFGETGLFPCQHAPCLFTGSPIVELATTGVHLDAN